MKTKIPMLILQAAAFAAVFLFTTTAEAVPPNKVPGQGYFDGDMVKDKGACNKCRKSKSCGKCESKTKAKKYCASSRCVKVVPARPDSTKNPRKPYWKRKVG
ncbi:MAG: hypothetical protein MI807_07250 [Verrucomicrobiales bacterium]|nr:hypothetical protein [Verrucomicrobiales bacterium]